MEVTNELMLIVHNFGFSDIAMKMNMRRRRKSDVMRAASMVGEINPRRQILTSLVDPRTVRVKHL